LATGVEAGVQFSILQEQPSQEACNNDSATPVACAPANSPEAEVSVPVLPLQQHPVRVKPARIEKQPHHPSNLLRAQHHGTVVLYCLVDVLLVVLVWFETLTLLDLLNPWLSIQILAPLWVILSASFASWMSTGNVGWLKWLDSLGTVHICLGLLGILQCG
jgi:hypothetical protein